MTGQPDRDTANSTDDEDWLYHLPAFLDQVREKGAHGIVENLDAEVGGVLYHHRGVRIPGYNATFIWHGDTFEVEVDAVGPRSAWATFDADRAWDFYLSRVPGDEPCLAWMTDAEFPAEEADESDRKQDAVATGRFSFGLYLHPPATWEDLHDSARESTAPFFIHRPSGRTLVPAEDADRSTYKDVVPPELRGDETAPPEHLGLVDAHVDRG